MACFVVTTEACNPDPASRSSPDRGRLRAGARASWALPGIQGRCSFDSGLVDRGESRSVTRGARRAAVLKQYRAIRYTERLAEANAVASVGSKCDSYDKRDGQGVQLVVQSRARA